MIAIASSEENATPSIRRKTHKINSRKSMGGSHFVGTRYGTVDLHKEALLQANEVFQSLDTDKNGKIDAAELGRAFLCLDVDIPNSHKTQVVDAMLHYLGKDLDAEIDHKEFNKLWSAYLAWKKRKEKQAPSQPLFPPVAGNHPIKLSLFLIFDDPSSCRVAQITSIVVIITIILSVITFVIETLPTFRKWESGKPGHGQEIATTDTFAVIEVYSITLFTIEYLARFLLVGFAPPETTSAWKKVLSFFIHPMNIVDLIAILPFYLELMSSNESGDSAFGVLRILRVARVFRVFKLGKYSAGLQLFAKVILESFSALLLLIFFLMIAVVLFGSLAYSAERGVWDHQLNGFARPDVTGLSTELTPFTSIPASFWWVLTTSTTVGYGDMYPTSIEGKMIGFVTMLMGILALALPVTIIGSNFAKIHAQHHRDILIKDQKGLIAMWRETAALQQLTGMNAAGVQRRSNYVVDMDQKEQDKVVNDADTKKKELALGLENCVLQLRSALEAVNEMKIKLAQLD